MQSKPTLVLFARYPRRGQVKTRLSRGFPEETVLKFYRAMLFDTLERLATLPARRIVAWDGCTIEESEFLFEDEPELRQPFEMERQAEGDLGQRLLHAYRRISETSPVLFLGTDTPTVPLAYLRRAMLALDRTPVVLGPTEDGGYYLLGLSASREVFRAIDWGTDRVLHQTLARLTQKEWLLLPYWHDIDYAEDLLQLRGSPGPRMAAILGSLQDGGASRTTGDC